MEIYSIALKNKQNPNIFILHTDIGDFDFYSDILVRENITKGEIDSEKFIENFIRRFAENASLAHTYKIDIYDINETPPKVSLVVSTADQSTSTSLAGEEFTFSIVNRLDAILETTY